MDNEMIKLLSAKNSPLQEALLEHCRKLLKPARSKMQQHYAEWDQRHETYMRRRGPTKDDIEAVRQGLPRKIVVPLSYSQINTFTAFAYMLLTQRERFFELTPTEDSDQTMRECCEQVLQRDMHHTNYKQRLVQNCLDVGRFGMSAEVDWWEQEYVWLPISEPGVAPSYNGEPTGPAPVITKLQRVLRREGNCVRHVSPYRVFLDPAVHPTDWQRGSFVAWDDEFSKSALMQLQEAGLCAGVDLVEPYSFGSIVENVRGASRFSGIDKTKPNESTVICVTQMVVYLSPAQIKDRNGNTLGSDNVPHRWLIWIANDNRIIRAEPQINLHAQFPMSVSFFAPDQHEAVFNSLAYMIDDLQSLISWFMNSRMAAVTRTIDNQIVVDPLGINISDVTARQRIIRLEKGGAGKDVRRFFMPLEVKDSTAGHVGDMSNLIATMQLISGVNDNMLGQVAQGRRSATENRAANQGAASRMKMVVDAMWGGHYVPQANRLLTNARQAMSPEEFALVCGQQKAAYFQQFRATPQVLARAYDFVAYDGTLPSEKLFLAQQLNELMALLISNPVAALNFNMDPTKVQAEIMELRGLGRGSQFAFDEQKRMMLAAQMQAQAQQENAQNAPANNS